MEFTYVELNVHAVTDEDWNYVKERIVNILGHDVDILPQSSTELLLSNVSVDEVPKLCNIKFVERVGIVVKLFQKDKLTISELVEFLRKEKLVPIPRVEDMRIRIMLKNIFRNCDGKLCLLRDLSIMDREFIAVILPIYQEQFQDLADPWSGTLGRLTPQFVVCDVESENELLSCARAACALKFKMYLVNPRLSFSDRRKRAEFWKFFNISKSKIFKTLEECLDYLRARRGHIVAIALSMHASSGENKLMEIVKNHGLDHVVFVLGGERWGLSPRQVELCDYVVRVGPSTGIPLSISEVMCYVTCLLRGLLRT